MQGTICPIIMGMHGLAKFDDLPGVGTGICVMIQVLLVDEQAVVRQGLRMRLALEPDLEIVGAARSSEEALGMARTITPDVVVMDIDMPGVDGFQAIRQMRDAMPGAAVIVLTLREGKDVRAQALQAGALAFIDKQGGAEPLLLEIRRLAAGVADEGRSG